MRQLLSILLLAAPAFAQIDDACPPGVGGPLALCQPRVGVLLEGSIFIAHRSYWQQRRALLSDVGNYRQCLGGVQEIELLAAGQMLSIGDPQILTISNNLRAHPIVDGVSLTQANNEIARVSNLRAYVQQHLAACREWRADILEYLNK